MPLTILFIIVLAVCFLIVLFFTRSTETERVVRRRLATLDQEAETQQQTGASILKQERLSPSPAVHDLLMKTPGTDKLLSLVKQAGADWWVSSIVANSLLLFGAGFLAGAIFFDTKFFVIVLALAAGFLPAGYLLFLRRRKLEACDALLPQAIELMARALRAGHALNSAIEMVSRDVPEPLGTEFRMVYEQQALGLPLREALMELLDRIPRDDMRFLTTALLLQKETGGNLVQILDATTTIMKERKRIKGQIRIYTAQARATAWVVGGLPFIMFMLMNAASPGYESEMLNDPVGSKVFYGGIVSWAIGIIAIKKIVTIKV